MKRTWIIAAVIAVLAIALGAEVVLTGSKDPNKTASMTDMHSSSSQSTDLKDSSAVATDTVSIQNFAFSPAAITVKVGTKVTWTNKDSAPHTVTADTESGDAPASNQLGQNDTYSFTFNKTGTYPYHCLIHPDMTAKVIVTQ